MISPDTKFEHGGQYIEKQDLRPDLDFGERIESLKERYFMYPHLINGLVTGKYEDLPRSAIDKMVQENFFSSRPLTPLNAEENRILRSQVTDRLTRILNSDDYVKLCGPIYYRQNGNGFWGKGIYTEASKDRRLREDNLSSEEFQLLTPENKIEMFFKPEIFRNMVFYSGNGNGTLKHYGNRDLIGKMDEYFQSKGEFTDFLAKIRQKTGVETLTVLDIGCGMGKALQDAKEIDANLETHGITQEQEPAMFNADYFHYIHAERFPTEFKNKFHWINSQVAFRYFTFQHIALRNVLLSLAKGGFARLGFSYEAKHDSKDAQRYLMKRLAPGSESGYDAMKTLVQREMAKLDALQQAGKIRYETDEDFKENGNQGYLGIEKLDDWDKTDIDLITGPQLIL